MLFTAEKKYVYPEKNPSDNSNLHYLLTWGHTGRHRMCLQQPRWFCCGGRSRSLTLWTGIPPAYVPACHLVTKSSLSCQRILLQPWSQQQVSNARNTSITQTNMIHTGCLGCFWLLVFDTYHVLFSLSLTSIRHDIPASWALLFLNTIIEESI